MEISVQHIQLRNELNNPKKIKETLNTVKNIGLTGIELNNFMMMKLPLWVRWFTALFDMKIGNNKKADWVKLVNESGLKVTALHTDVITINKNIDDLIKKAKAFNTKYIVITGMFNYDYSKESNIIKLASTLNTIGKTLKENNISLLYHNHNCEFQRLENKKLAIDVLIENLNPEYVNLELDVYWAYDAGYDAIKFMDKYKNRIFLLHLNDRGLVNNKKKASILKYSGTEIGNGNLPFKDILLKAKELNIDTLTIETQNNWIDNSGIKSLEISYTNLNKIIKEENL